MDKIVINQTSRNNLNMSQIVVLLSLLLITTTYISCAYTPTNATCSLARATYYNHNGAGSCGFDSINTSVFTSSIFDLNFGFAPNELFYKTETQCGECYQLIGPYGARDTASTNPKPIIAMVTDVCPVGDNVQWCSADMTHFDLRVGAWDSLVNADRSFEPFQFTYQKVVCPFDANTSPVSVQVVDVNQWYLSLRPFFHAIAVETRLLIKESGATDFKATATATNDFQFTYQSSNPIKYPLVVRVTAMSTSETIDITVSSPSVGAIYQSDKQFSYTAKQEAVCSYHVEPTVYDDILYRGVADNHRTADDWRLYPGSTVTNLQSTAVTPKSGSYVFEAAFSGWGTLQIARKTPLYKDSTVALQLDVRSSQTLSQKLSIAFNDAGGQPGASQFYFFDTTTSWKTITMYLNTSDIPSELYIIYMQLQTAEANTFYFDNIKWIMVQEQEQVGESSTQNLHSSSGPSVHSSTSPELSVQSSTQIESLFNSPVESQPQDISSGTNHFSSELHESSESHQQQSSDNKEESSSTHQSTSNNLPDPSRQPTQNNQGDVSNPFQQSSNHEEEVSIASSIPHRLVFVAGIILICISAIMNN
jgi:hypothetical protein